MNIAEAEIRKDGEELNLLIDPKALNADLYMIPAR